MPLTSKAAIQCSLFVKISCVHSFFLWEISHPSKNGAPTIKLEQDELLSTISKPSSPYFQLLDHVIIKAFNQYSIPLDITDNIRNSFSSKLWRMGQQMAKLGGYSRRKHLEMWKKENW